MHRLGELLVASGSLTTEEVEQALRAQVMWGGRLGTNLIELGYLDLDMLSKLLGRQHGLPAALARHFEKADATLQKRLSPDVAERYSCVPLLPLTQHRVAIAALAPIDRRGIAIIADELALEPAQVVIAVAAELRIRYYLERVYRIPRSTRFLRSRGKTIPAFPQFQILPVDEVDAEILLPTPEPPPIPPPGMEGPGPETDEPVDLSSLAVLEDDDASTVEHASVEPTGRERRTYVRTIADQPSSDSERALARIAIRKVAIPSGVQQLGVTLGEATRAIRRAPDRDKVADLVIDAISRFLTGCDAAVILVMRGAVAIGWKGYSRAGTALPEIAVPFDQPGLLPRAVQRGQTQRSPAAELTAIDRLLVDSLTATPDNNVSELVIAPVTIGGQVMCVLALAATSDVPAASIEQIAAATGAAFARLMRDASR